MVQRQVVDAAQFGTRGCCNGFEQLCGAGIQLQGVLLGCIQRDPSTILACGDTQSKTDGAFQTAHEFTHWIVHVQAHTCPEYLDGHDCLRACPQIA